jgi:release factor glutamine methyltransferase
VVSNPPYIAAGEREALPEDVRSFEPPQALFSGASGLDAAREIVDQAPHHLVPGGLLALELAEERAHQVAGWLQGAPGWQAVEVRDDLARRPRYLLARAAVIR